MTWGEALRLVRKLQADPSSWVAASIAGWRYPISHEALVLADIFDVEVMVNSDRKKGKPKPHGIRPFDVDDKERTRKGDAAGRTREEVLAILREHGHQIPV